MGLQGPRSTTCPTPDTRAKSDTDYIPSDNCRQSRTEIMRAFPKIVAATLGLLLGALPLFAAIPCTTERCTPRRCACCASMQRSGMTSQSVTVGTEEQSVLSRPQCGKPSSAGSIAPAMVREARRAISQVESSPAVDASSRILTGAAREIRSESGRSTGRSVQSVLCTFLI